MLLFFRSVNKLPAKKVLMLIGIILCIYLIFFLLNFWQLSSFLNGGNSTSLNTTKSSPHSNTTYNNPSNSDYTNSSNNKNSFDINQYIPEENLKEIYEEYYSDAYDSYDEFREALSKYFYYKYYSN